MARYLLLDPNGPSVTVGILSPFRSTNGAVGFGPLSTAYTLRHYRFGGSGVDNNRGHNSIPLVNQGLEIAWQFVCFLMKQQWNILRYMFVHTRDRILGLICVLVFSFIFVHCIASYDATSCRLFGISRGRAWCHHHVMFWNFLYLATDHPVKSG